MVIEELLQAPERVKRGKKKALGVPGEQQQGLAIGEMSLPGLCWKTEVFPMFFLGMVSSSPFRPVPFEPPQGASSQPSCWN